MTKKSGEMTRESNEALELWESLHSHLLNAQVVIQDIIETRAWEPLGYSSFYEAWNARMADLTLALEIRPHIVYQMITEGATDAQIVTAVKGIGEGLANRIREQKANGVPPECASMSKVRSHLRKKPKRADSIHLKIGTIRLTRYQAIAKRHGKSVEDIALDAIESRFSQL